MTISELIKDLDSKMAKAEPVPWESSEYCAEIEGPKGVDGYPIMKIYDEGGHSIADAAAIVSLVNSYEQLRDAAMAGARLAVAISHRDCNEQRGTGSCKGCEALREYHEGPQELCKELNGCEGPCMCTGACKEVCGQNVPCIYHTATKNKYEKENEKD